MEFLKGKFNQKIFKQTMRCINLQFLAFLPN